MSPPPSLHNWIIEILQGRKWQEIAKTANWKGNLNCITLWRIVLRYYETSLNFQRVRRNCATSSDTHKSLEWGGMCIWHPQYFWTPSPLVTFTPTQLVGTLVLISTLVCFGVPHSPSQCEHHMYMPPEVGSHRDISTWRSTAKQLCSSWENGIWLDLLMHHADKQITLWVITHYLRYWRF